MKLSFIVSAFSPLAYLTLAYAAPLPGTCSELQQLEQKLGSVLNHLDQIPSVTELGSDNQNLAENLEALRDIAQSELERKCSGNGDSSQTLSRRQVDIQATLKDLLVSCEACLIATIS